MQAPDVIDITSIELIQGLQPESFVLLVRSREEREASWFWARSNTFVLDIKKAYNPYRGEALGEMLLPGIRAVRASQFLEGEVPVARIEVDVETEKGVRTVWTAEGVEVHFGPPGPPIPAPTLAGRVTPPAGETTGTPPPATVPLIRARRKSC